MRKRNISWGVKRVFSIWWLRICYSFSKEIFIAVLFSIFLSYLCIILLHPLTMVGLTDGKIVCASSGVWIWETETSIISNHWNFYIINILIDISPTLLLILITIQSFEYSYPSFHYLNCQTLNYPYFCFKKLYFWNSSLFSFIIDLSRYWKCDILIFICVVYSCYRMLLIIWIK